MPKGSLAFVLHAHLPFVRHPEYDSFLEERWYFEAMTETYIPLLKFLYRLTAEKVPFRITISLSPTLLAMMDDPLLQERYEAHVDRLADLARREQERHRHDGHLRWLAGMYEGLFREALEMSSSCGHRLWRHFQRLNRLGPVELITTAATHGLLPVLSSRRAAVEAQVATGLDYFSSLTGIKPAGIWLPECGYFPGLDAVLAREGLRYFFVEGHAVQNASVAPVHGLHAPIFTPSGVAAFGRDRGSSKDVWSAREGFPGDPDYREFYRDIGYDADMDYIRPFIAGDVRVDTGIKYFRITGPTQKKQPYQPDKAREKAAIHAGEFLRRRSAHVEYLSSVMTVEPVIIAPFDAELFGHWWFEGPQWLDFVIRKAAFDQNSLALTTPSEYLDRNPVHQAGVPCASTWGHKGFFEAWINPKTDWIYPLLDECARRLERLVAAHSGKMPSALKRRALNQCLRELLLAQGSDWPFIINGGTAVEYAGRRVKDHVSRFHCLAADLESGRINEERLAMLESMDAIFPGADFRVFRDRG